MPATFHGNTPVLPDKRRRWLRARFSLRMLLLAFTAFAIGFPIWYRWPYEVVTEQRDPTTGALQAKRIVTRQRQWGGTSVQHGPERIVGGDVTFTTNYVRGRRHGPFTVRDTKARQSAAGQYVDDMREGRWASTRGEEKSIAHYHRGKLDGPLEVDACLRTARGKVSAVFKAGRLVEFNGQPMKDRLVDILESGAIDERTASELQRESQIDVVQMPLKDCLLYLSEMHQIPFVLDPNRIRIGELQADLAITEDYGGLDLCSILTLLTAPRGLACDYRYGRLWITTIQDVQNWHDPTGVAEIRPPAASDLARAWNEPAIAAVTTSPLAEVVATFAKPLQIDMDITRIKSSPDNSNGFPTISDVNGLPFRHALGILLYETDCRCKLDGSKLVILPPEDDKRHFLP